MTNLRTDIYTKVTDAIVADLANGVRPWSKPWNSGVPVSLPLRHMGEAYRGINVLILWCEAMEKGYTSNRWMTYRQAQELGGQVKRGEKSTLVVYAKSIGKSETDDSGDTVGRSVYLTRSYSVFNCDQIEGLPTLILSRGGSRESDCADRAGRAVLCGDWRAVPIWWRSRLLCAGIADVHSDA